MSRRILNLRSRLPKVLLLATVGLLSSAGIAQATTENPVQQPPEFACQQGEFCAWTGEFYSDQIQQIDLRTANPEECVPLPDDFDGQSFANRSDRLVTVYQDRDCSTEGDFTTYPGGGTFVPQAPFVARAIEIWDE
jgi:hypothetical protein